MEDGRRSSLRLSLSPSSSYRDLHHICSIVKPSLSPWHLFEHTFCPNITARAFPTPPIFLQHRRKSLPHHQTSFPRNLFPLVILAAVTNRHRQNRPRPMTAYVHTFWHCGLSLQRTSTSHAAPWCCSFFAEFPQL